MNGWGGGGRSGEEIWKRWTQGYHSLSWEPKLVISLVANPGCMLKPPGELYQVPTVWTQPHDPERAGLGTWPRHQYFLLLEFLGQQVWRRVEDQRWRVLSQPPPGGLSPQLSWLHTVQCPERATCTQPLKREGRPPTPPPPAETLGISLPSPRIRNQLNPSLQSKQRKLLLVFTPSCGWHRDPVKPCLNFLSGL